MIIETSLAALQAGQTVELSPGDILRVTVTFNAAMPSDATTELWISLVIPPARDYTVKKLVALSKSVTPLPYSVVVDMPITTTVGLGNRAYDLWAELPSYPGAQVKILGAITITGMPSVLGGIGDMIIMMVVMMMLMLVMEQTREIYEPPGTPPRPKPITEAAVKAAKWVGREAVQLAEKGWKEAKKHLEEAYKEWKDASKEEKAEKEGKLRWAKEREIESRRRLAEERTRLTKREEYY